MYSIRIWRPGSKYWRFMQLKKRLLVALVLVITSFFALPAQATIKWSDCRTEVVVTNLAAGVTSSTVTLKQPVTTSNKAFVLVSSTGKSSVQAGSDHLVSAYITGAGQVQVDRNTAADQIELALTVVECFNDEFTVQRNTVTLAAGQSLGTSSISSVDSEKSMVIVSSRTSDSTANESMGLVTGHLSSTTEVEIRRDVASATQLTNVEYQVVTFSEESGVQVHSNSADAILSPGDTTEDIVLDSAVNLDNTWLYCSWDAADVGLRQNSLGCALENDETVRFYRYSGGANAYTNHLQYYLVEFPPETVTLERQVYNSDPNDTDNNEYSEYIQIGDIGDRTKAFVYVTNTIFGTAANYPRNRWLSYLNSAVSLQNTFWRPLTTNLDANTKYIQIIRFPHYEATGWGLIANSNEDYIGGSPGLISFNCDNLTYGYFGFSYCDDSSRFDYAVQLDSGGCSENCDVTGEAWLGVYESSVGSPDPIGIIDFDPTIGANSAPTLVGDDPSTPENETLDAHWNEETGEVYGWARFRTLADYEDTIYGTALDNWGWIKLRGEVQDGACTPGVDCGEYGVLFDTDTQTFSSWAWNYNGSDHASGTEIEGSGFGWIKFDLSETPGGANAWLKTLTGDVFVNADINTTAPPTTPQQEYGATYLIQANGTIKNYNSQYADSDPQFTEESGVDPINFPEDNSSQVYRGDIGDIHVSELIEQATEDGNAYGTSTTPVNCDASIFTGHTSPLNGEVFYCSGDLTIDSNLTFNNGIDLQLGSGTVIVGGDLFIKENVSYFGEGYNAINHINNVASLAWLVQGSVQIDPDVNRLAGAFIVLGDAGANPDFSTGTGGDPLRISGLVMARSFKFERTHTGTDEAPEPSEEIIYDGRLSVNPPPGLADFSKILPN